MLANAAQKRRAARRAAEQLDRLHRHDAQREPAVEDERPRVGDDRRDVEPVGARAQLREQLAIDVERRDLMTGARELERDSPGAGADVQDRSAMLGGEHQPQPKVLRVAPALDVVPDDAHAAPRGPEFGASRTRQRTRSVRRSRPHLVARPELTDVSAAGQLVAQLQAAPCRWGARTGCRPRPTRAPGPVPWRAPARRAGGRTGCPHI